MQRGRLLRGRRRLSYCLGDCTRRRRNPPVLPWRRTPGFALSAAQCGRFCLWRRAMWTPAVNRHPELTPWRQLKLIPQVSMSSCARSRRVLVQVVPRESGLARRVASQSGWRSGAAAATIHGPLHRWCTRQRKTTQMKTTVRFQFGCHAGSEGRSSCGISLGEPRDITCFRKR